VDLFSELYSESPRPVNLHGEHVSDDDDGGDLELLHNDSIAIPEIHEDDGDFFQLFDECRSIEDEESSDDDSFRAHDIDIASNNELTTEVVEVEVGTELMANSGSIIANDAPASSSRASSKSLLALSEIESQEDILPPLFDNATAEAMPPDAAASATPSSARSNGGSSSTNSTPSSSSSRSSPSFGNRLFRRAFGRLANSSSRRSGGGDTVP